MSEGVEGGGGVEERGELSQLSFALCGARPRKCSPGFIHTHTNARKNDSEILLRYFSPN